MEFTDNPSGEKGKFQLMYGTLLIGILTYENNFWSFNYSEELKQNRQMNPIIDFPDLNKVYTSEQLWPFFAARIPALNQPYQLRKIARARISKNDAVGLLKLFGKDTITNPFRLNPV